MNVYKNLLNKVKLLLKEDDNLTKTQSEQHQWQLLVKVEDRTFNVGKGGVNTIFYSSTSKDRAVCYPDEIVSLLETLSSRKVFMYLALDRRKKELGYAIDREGAKTFENAVYIAAVNFKNARRIEEQKIADLTGKEVWKPVRRV